MKLATLIWKNAERVGAIAEGHIYDLAGCLKASGKGDPAMAASVAAFLAAGPIALDRAAEAVVWVQAHGVEREAHPLDQVKLLAPIPRLENCCVWRQLRRSHPGGRWNVRRQGEDDPRFFIKPHTVVVGPGDPIRIPPSAAWADWELELAVVIGKAGRDIAADRAAEHIAGYTIFNDISARELTFRQALPLSPETTF